MAQIVIAAAAVGALGLGAYSTIQQGKQADKAEAQARRAEANRQALQDKQDAQNRRLRINEETRQEELGAREARQQRALRARNRGRSALAYQPSSGLKETLG